MDNNEKDAKKIGNMIKKIAKIRLEGQQVRKQTMAKESTVHTINPRKYSRATGNESLELILIEGDSAKGLANQARDKLFQELYALKGVPQNSYGLKYYDLWKNEEFKELITIMGMDVGPKKNLAKRKHDRFIIMTDADIDGNRITSLLAVFFLCFYPELVEEGRVYKALPPLYSCAKPINGSKYIQNNKDLNKIIRKAVNGKHEIYSVQDKKKLKETDINKLLEINNHYLRELNSLSNKVSIHPFLLEFIMSNLDKSYEQLAKMINKEFRFMDAKIHKKQLTVEGVYEKNFQYTVINDKLISKCKKLNNYIVKNKNLFGLKFKVDGEVKTLFELLNVIEKFKPDMSRFKGLGEMKYTQLAETTLDPENRHLVRLTTKDLQKDIESFAILHSTKKKDAEARAKLFETFEIDIDDIDN